MESIALLATRLRHILDLTGFDDSLLPIFLEIASIMNFLLPTLRITTLVALFFGLPNVSLKAGVVTEILTGEAFFNFAPNPSVGLDLSINLSSNVVDIFMSGRDDGWFGIGFGNDNMDDTYAIVITQTGAPSEYRLGTFGVNTPIDSTVSVIGSSVVDSIRTIHLQRAADLGVAFPQHFAFPTTPGFLALAGATGPGGFNFHQNRGGNVITLSASAVPEPGSVSLVIACASGFYIVRRRFRCS